ncbi:hypothetical protein CP556_05355 [Natrinema sp. CBA1119]|nr:hypothetical protein CP556_05355 [Natrinema sp. CBA1119]
MLDESTLNSTFAYMRNIFDQDQTIDTQDYPWTDFPVAYTIYDSDSDIGRGLAQQYFGQGRSQTPAQLIGLSSIISPVLRLGDQISASIERYRRVLDAETWVRPRSQLESIVQSLDWVPAVDFTIRDSEQTPGIQLADIAAYSRRKRLQDGDCHEAMRYLHKLLL